MAGRNVLLMSFNVIIDTVKVEHCIDHLVSHSLISKDQKSKLSQSTLPPERRMKILELLQGKVLEESSIFLTCLPEQVSRLLPLCNRRLINLGLDKSRQDQLMTRYAMLNRGQAEEYASQLSEKVNELAKENEYMLKIPLLLNLLSLMAQNEELSERTSSLTLQLKTVFDIYPFIYCIQRGMQYDPDNPPNDVMYALKQLQTLALETVLEKPATIIPLEHVQQNYGCKLLMQAPLHSKFDSIITIVVQANHWFAGDFALSLECVNECDNKKEVVRAISQSLPPRLLVLPDQIHSTTTIRGLNMILEKNFSRVSHVSVTLNSSTHFNMDIVQELAYSIRRSTSVTDLYVSYTSTELLTFFLSHITSDYRANLLTIVCESKATLSEKLTASTYTQLKSCISSLSGITTFTLVGCRNSLTLRNIIRHLPPILATLEIKECLFDSVSALDISSYLERASGLFVLSLEKCELADGATEMNLFKGLRSNKSLVNLRLRGSSLNVQALKVLCEALKFTRALKHLDLTQIELSTPVCSALASAINVSCSLKDLKLTTSQVCSEGLTSLGETEKEGFKLIQE
ncbi:uncharacterized protein [Watersipora subatra]|uniref:uncharacterized protein n=1 Tax=Watersipora subatra TaxID=2589382 RepID=UPI00355B3076